jgi:Na+-transporting methylmalonyl-CoA/oxaloacetate decarboxylase gamma subunit
MKFQKIKDLYNKIKPKRRWQKIVFTIILILVLIFIGRAIFGTKAVEEEKVEKSKLVEVARIFDIANQAEALPVIGKVESQSEAILRAEAQGEISRVN